ncbi:LPXTG cell wall anchor domain-containing protein [Lacticaseibacillus absianus]|uniref:LPXTG cell wall anchor domain-containing protein n=1 Tax=Lacticaseibacillus absianus TaxID=2729623 RepID=UPI0015CEF029|nr:LPXTG cell wall anchor domain-containing protein [Lacticaseibacillus absianus]
MHRINRLMLAGLLTGCMGVPLTAPTPTHAAATQAATRTAEPFFFTSRLGVAIPELPDLANSGIGTVLAAHAYTGTATINYYGAQAALPLTALELTSSDARAAITTGAVQMAATSGTNGTLTVAFTLTVTAAAGDTVVTSISLRRTDNGHLTLAPQTLTLFVTDPQPAPEPLPTPEGPSIPETPDRPIAPEPSTPPDPTDPSTPTEPLDPATPEPTDPSTPTEPADPTTPTDPQAPVDPLAPITPPTPGAPAEQADPLAPADPAPSAPVTDPLASTMATPAAAHAISRVAAESLPRTGAQPAWTITVLGGLLAIISLGGLIKFKF